MKSHEHTTRGASIRSRATVRATLSRLLETQAAVTMEDSVLEESRWAGVREVMGMSGPIILGTMSHTAMQFVDQTMISRLGIDAFAAAGSAGIWSFVLGCFIIGVVGCVSTFVSQSLGRGQTANCARYGWQGIYISLLAGVLAAALWPVAGPLFDLMEHAPEVTRLELTYFRIRLFGYVSMAWVAALTAFFQATGRPGTPMWTGIVANILNLVLNYGLIFGHLGLPRLEIAGAAWATVISVTAHAAMLQGVFLGPRTHTRYRTRRAYAFDPARCKELLRIGLPSGISFFMDVANWGIFTSFIVGRFGTVALAAHNAAIGFMHISFMPAVGLNHGIAPIVGKRIGEGNVALAEARTYTAMRIAIAYMTVMGLIFAVFGSTMIRVVFKQPPDVVALGHTLLILAAIFQAFDAVNITVMGALRGAGDTRWIAVVMFLFAYFFFLPLAIVLAFFARMGALGAWIGATAYIIGLSGILFARFRGERWRHIRIFTQDK